MLRTNINRSKGRFQNPPFFLQSKEKKINLFNVELTGTLLSPETLSVTKQLSEQSNNPLLRWAVPLRKSLTVIWDIWTLIKQCIIFLFNPHRKLSSCQTISAVNIHLWVIVCNFEVVSLHFFLFFFFLRHSNCLRATMCEMLIILMSSCPLLLLRVAR